MAARAPVCVRIHVCVCVARGWGGEEGVRGKAEREGGVVDAVVCLELSCGTTVFALEILYYYIFLHT